MKRSIQAVLLGGTIAVLVAVLGGAAWVAYEAGQDEAEELFDARLATSARVLEALVARQLEETLYGWGGEVESNAVDVHIHNLRRKLYPAVIRTVRGVGYVADPPAG